MEGQLHANQPVWKKEKGATRYIRYRNDLKYWIVAVDLNDAGFFLFSTVVPLVPPHQKAIPRSGWNYWDGETWASDDTSLTISGG